MLSDFEIFEKYSRTIDLNRSVISPVILLLNQYYYDNSISYKLIKEGRRYTKIKFNFEIIDSL